MVAKTKTTKKKKVEEVETTSKEEQLPLGQAGSNETEVAPEEGLANGEDKDSKGKEKYFQAVGRRKESIARVWLLTKKSSDSSNEETAMISVNGKDYAAYFTDKNLQLVVESPLRKLKSLNRFKASVKVNGGGLAGQADAVKHGIARALEKFDSNFRKKLKKGGFLTRDPRAKERRKYGLKKARKAPQWQKR